MTTPRANAFLILLAMVGLIGQARAGEGCRRCGCDHVTRLTRLVRLQKPIEIPTYQCKSSEAFYPKKGVVCHTGYRVDHHLTLDYQHHCCEQCVKHEHCEDVKHYVRKNACDTECHTEHHHPTHFDRTLHCDVTCCIKCKTECGCKTLHGARPDGCFKESCLSVASAQPCVKNVTEVRWVTINLCTNKNCGHSWCDAPETECVDVHSTDSQHATFRKPLPKDATSGQHTVQSTGIRSLFRR